MIYITIIVKFKMPFYKLVNGNRYYRLKYFLRDLNNFVNSEKNNGTTMFWKDAYTLCINVPQKEYEFASYLVRRFNYHSRVIENLEVTSSVV